METKPMTKSEIINSISEKMGIPKKQVVEFFDTLFDLMKGELTKRCTTFTIPGLVRVKAVQKPATAERKGISPLTKKEVIFKAKPARLVVKASPIKALKDAVS